MTEREGLPTPGADHGPRPAELLMEFALHPGELPFATMRDAKWVELLRDRKTIDIIGVHGCTLERQTARVDMIQTYDGPPPPRLAETYKGKKLVLVWLAPIE
jgi:hypothetical protein